MADANQSGAVVTGVFTLLGGGLGGLIAFALGERKRRWEVADDRARHEREMATELRLQRQEVYALLLESVNHYSEESFSVGVEIRAGRRPALRAGEDWEAYVDTKIMRSLEVTRQRALLVAGKEVGELVDEVNQALVRSWIAACADASKEEWDARIAEEMEYRRRLLLAMRKEVQPTPGGCTWGGQASPEGSLLT